MIDDDECGTVCAMRIARGNLSSRSKHTPSPLRPHDLTWARARAAALGSGQLAAFAMVRPRLRS
jgi:hypothetical protein